MDKEQDFYGTATPPSGDTGFAARQLFEASQSRLASYISTVAQLKLMDIGVSLASNGKPDVEQLRLEAYYWRNAPYLFQRVAQELISVSIPQQEETEIDE